MSDNIFSGTCAGIVLEKSSMMLVFTIVSNSGEDVKYACTCQSFAEGAGIRYEDLNVDDWESFCSSMKGKKLNFVIKDG